jgi:tetratricopeptide (TPR) repeat protein
MPNSISLPWWLKGIAAGALVAIILVVAYLLPPEWAWTVLLASAATILVFLYLNPRRRYFRLSRHLILGWLAIRGLDSIALLLWVDERPWYLIYGGETPWSFDFSIAIVVVAFAFFDSFQEGDFSIKVSKIGPTKDNSGNVANLVVGDGSQVNQTLTQVAGDQHITQVNTDPNKVIGEAESHLKADMVDVTIVQLESLQRDHPEILTSQQNLRIAKLLASAYLIREDYDKAADLYFKASKHAASDLDAATFEALAYWLSEDTERAISLCDVILNDEPNNKDGWFLSAVLKRPPEDVSEFYHRIPKHLRSDSNIMSAMVLRATEAKAWDLALQFSDALLACDTELSKASRSAGRAFALTCFDAWMERHVRTVEDIQVMARKAISLLTKASELKSTGPITKADIYFHRSLAHRVLGDAQKSEQDLENAIKYQPRNTQLLFQKCLFLVTQGRVEEAITVLQSITHEPLTDGPVLILARLLFQYTGETSRAEKMLLDLLQNQQDHRLAFESLELLGSELARRNQTQKAEQHLQSFKYMFDEVATDTIRASIKQASGRSEEAREIAKKCHERHSDHTLPVVSVFLCRLLFELKLDVEAIDLIEQMTGTSAAGFLSDLALEVGYRSNRYDLVLTVAEKMRTQGRPTIRSAELELSILETLNEFDESQRLIEHYIAKSEASEHFLETKPEVRVAFLKCLRFRRAAIGVRLESASLLEYDQSKLPGIDDCGPGKSVKVGLVCAVAAYLQKGPIPDAGFALAEQLYRKHNEDPAVHKCLIQTFGFQKDYKPRIFVTVEPGVAVRFFNCETKTLEWKVIVDSSPITSQNEWAKDHPTARAMVGKKVGDSFCDNSDAIAPLIGTIEEIIDANRYRVKVAMDAFGDRFGDRTFIRKFNFDRPDKSFDIDKWIRVNERFNEPIEQARRLYRYDLPSISLFASFTGRTLIEAMGHIASHPDFHIHYGDATIGETERVASVLEAGSMFVLDPTSLATIFTIGFHEKVPKLPECLVVSAGTLQELRLELLNPHSRLHSKMIGGVENGRPFTVEYDDQTVQKRVDAYKSFIEWIERNAKVEGGRAILDIDVQAREQMIRLFGTSTVESLAIACRKQCVLISDDVVVERFPELNLKPNRTNTATLIGHFFECGDVSESTKTELFHRLVAADFRYTPINGKVILHAAQLAEWRTDNVNLACIVDWLHNSGAGFARAVSAAIEIVITVWSGCILEDRRIAVVRDVTRSLAKRADAFSTLRAIRLEFQAYFEGDELALDEATSIVDRELNHLANSQLLILPGNPLHVLPPRIARSIRARI